jgi:hypothetical protein
MPTGVLHLKEVDTDEITLDGTLSVSGASTLEGATVAHSTLSVGGAATLADTNANNVNVSGTLSVAGQTTISGAIIPDTNDAYDIGSPEFKIRDLYVSNNSIWVGDDMKISNEGGKLKFRKRKTDVVPQAIIAAGATAGHANEQATADAALAHAGVGHLSQMKLQHWFNFMRTMNQFAKITDIFRENNDDYEESSASDAWKEIPDTNKIYTNSMVGVGTSDPDDTLHVKGSLKVESETGFKLIRTSAGGTDPTVVIDTHNFGTDETVNDLTGRGDSKYTKLYRVYGRNSEGVGRSWYWGYANDDYANISLAFDGGGIPDPDIAFTFTTASELHCNKVFAALGGNADTATLAAAATKLETARKINGVDFDGTQDIALSLEASKLATPVNINGVPFDGSGDIHIEGFSRTQPIQKVATGLATNDYSYILNGPRPGTTSGGAAHFINGAGRGDDGGVSTYTIRNDSGDLRLGRAGSTTRIEGTVDFENPPSSSTSATKLATARKINGVAFDGTSNITVNGTRYDVNNAWLREKGDNAHVKLYGNSRQMVFRTDGTTEYASGIDGYAFVWMYGGDAASNRRMFLNTSGQLWCSNYGWLHDKFADKGGTGGQNFSANTIYIGNSTTRGLRAVSGNYGTVQTTGGGAGNWEGYSINGRYVFMSADNNQCGIFNDLDNEWMAHFNRNGDAQIYYNGASKLQTRSDGVNVTGDLLVGRVGYSNDIGYRIEKSGGDYMTVTTQGSRRSWGGYNIQNQWGIMAHTNGGTCGIYNDQENEWGLYCERNSHTRLMWNGSEKLRTESYGCRTTGRLYVYESTGTHRSSGTGSLTLARGDNNGSSSIVFPSAGNAGSDYAWINYDEDGGTGGEAAKLCIGITNDADDDIMMQCSGGVRIGGINNMGDPFGKLETDDPPSNSGTGGFRCHQSWKYGDGMWALAVDNTTGYNQNLYWYGRHPTNGTLHRVMGFENDSANRGTGGIFAFTGQHRNVVKNINPDNVEKYVGMIVSADNEENIKVAGGVARGLDAIEINETLPLLSITRKAKDKSVFGVVSGSEDYETRSNTVGNLTSYHDKESGDERIFVNSVGEGAIWVSDKNGSLESGDYVTSCDIPGYGMKQDSEFLANYTVAKLTMSCDFEATSRNKYLIRKEKRTVKGYKHKEGLALLTAEEYNAIETKREKRMYEYEEHEELVNVLDGSKKMVWDVVGKEAPYKMRFLRPDGVGIGFVEITQVEYEKLKSEGREVYRAAFVGCTYHCG